MHSINCTLHRPWHCAWNDLNWHPACILHGGQCTRLSSLCETEPEPSLPYSYIPPTPHISFLRLLTILEAGGTTLVGLGLVWWGLSRCHGHLSTPSPLPPEAVRVVSAIDAVACCSIGFPQCVPHDGTEEEVVHQVRSVELRDHTLLFVVWGSLDLSCRSEGDGVCNGDGWESWKPKPIYSGKQGWGTGS